MKRIVYLLVALIFITSGCQKVKDKIQKDLKKVDSLAQVAADSISEQIGMTDTVPEPEQAQPAEEQKENIYNLQLLTGIYQTILQHLHTKDSIILYQFLYFPDSVLTISSQGIFQVLSLEPLQALFNPEPASDSAWYCQPVLRQFPQLGDAGWTQEGCFVEPVKEFHKFSAILELAKEANIYVDPALEQKVKQVEPKIVYKVLNTYLNWTFFFAYDNGKYYLAGVDFNQY